MLKKETKRLFTHLINNPRKWEVQESALRCTLTLQGKEAPIRIIVVDGGTFVVERISTNGGNSKRLDGGDSYTSTSLAKKLYEIASTHGQYTYADDVDFIIKSDLDKSPKKPKQKSTKVVSEKEFNADQIGRQE